MWDEARPPQNRIHKVGRELLEVERSLMKYIPAAVLAEEVVVGQKQKMHGGKKLMKLMTYQDSILAKGSRRQTKLADPPPTRGSGRQCPALLCGGCAQSVFQIPGGFVE